MTPATFYAFRLAAENSIGRRYVSKFPCFERWTSFVCSEFSEIVQFSTSGTIPPEPDPPMLVEKGVKSLTLSWISRPIDDTFTLQMCDESNYFRNKYAGPSLTYTLTDLYRNTEYKFRVRQTETLPDKIFNSH